MYYRSLSVLPNPFQSIWAIRLDDDFHTLKLYSLKRIRLYQLPEMTTRPCQYIIIFTFLSSSRVPASPGLHSQVGRLFSPPSKSFICLSTFSALSFTQICVCLYKVCVKKRKRRLLFVNSHLPKKGVLDIYQAVCVQQGTVVVHCRKTNSHQEMLPPFLLNVNVYCAKNRQRKRFVCQQPVRSTHVLYILMVAIKFTFPW